MGIGTLRRYHDAPADSQGSAGGVGPDEDRPNANANKSDWSAYAETRGVETVGLTKAQIIEAVK